MFEEALRNFLVASLGIAVHVNDAYNASGDFLLIELTGRDDDHSSVVNGLRYDDYDFHFYAGTFHRAILMADDFYTRYNNFKGVMGAYNVTLMRQTNAYDFKENDSGSKVRVLSMSINYIRRP